LHIYLPAIGFIWRFTRERSTQCKFASQFLDILGPLFFIKEILVRTPAAVEKMDTSPVVECIWAVLLKGTPSECNPLLNEPTEWGNTPVMSIRRLKMICMQLTVPGPIIIIGLFGLAGRRKVDRRT
jgi:hypothetical protein